MNAPSHTKDQAKLFEILKAHALFKEKIILSSGKESDYYFDARRVTLSAAGAYLCGQIILDMVKDDALDAIGGPTLGADPLLGAIGVLSFQSGKPLNTFIIRKAPKPYGKQQQIEGPHLRPDSRVVLLDDVATTGKSFVESIEVLKKMGIKPLKAVCIVDRKEGAGQILSQHGCPLISIFDLTDFPL